MFILQSFTWKVKGRLGTCDLYGSGELEAMSKIQLRTWSLDSDEDEDTNCSFTPIDLLTESITYQCSGKVSLKNKDYSNIM